MTEPPAPAAPPAHPVFVGGIGRSGSTIVGELLGAHSAYAVIPIELKFHTTDNGLPDLLAGKTGVPEFLTAMRGEWWHYGTRRKAGRAFARGLHQILDLNSLEMALIEFERDFEHDRYGAARGLISAVGNATAAKAGKPYWVEMSPSNARIADLLLELFPEARVINVYRDPLDAASSRVARGWVPTMKEGLEEWARKMREVHRAAAQAPPGQVASVSLEDLAIRRRSPTFGALLRFLSLDLDWEMREFFDRKVRPELVHSGRWRAALEAKEIRRVERRYRKVGRKLGDQAEPPFKLPSAP